MEHATFEEITHPGVDDAPVPVMVYMCMHVCTTHIPILWSTEATTMPRTTVRQVRDEDAYQYQNIFGPLVKMEVPLSLPFLLLTTRLGSVGNKGARRCAKCACHHLAVVRVAVGELRGRRPTMTRR